MSKAAHQNDGQQQLNLFSVSGIPFGADQTDDHLIDLDHKFSKELIALADLPIGSSKNSPIIDIETINPFTGKSTAITVPGRVTNRVVPSPDYVKFKGAIVKRDTLSGKQLPFAQPLFVHLESRILFHKGRVTDLHYEIALAVVAIWVQRWQQEGVIHPALNTTRAEIATRLGDAGSTYVRTEINAALGTMAGMVIEKSWRPLEEDHYDGLSGHIDERNYTGVGFFQEVTIDGTPFNDFMRAHEESVEDRSWSREEANIRVVLGQHVVDSILGQGLEAPHFASRTINLQRMRRLSGWHQTLYRTLELRLSRAEEIAIPLEELWHEVLGCKRRIPNTSGWRSVRRDVRKRVREWAESEYLDRDHLEGYCGIETNVRRPFNIVREENGRSEVVHCKKGDWFVVRRGANFFVDKPAPPVVFYARVCKQLGWDEAECLSRLKRDSGDLERIRHAYSVAKSLVDQSPDCWHRLTSWLWFAQETPIPIERNLLMRCLMRNQSRASGKGPGGLWGHIAERRTQIMINPMRTKARGRLQKMNPQTLWDVNQEQRQSIKEVELSDSDFQLREMAFFFTMAEDELLTRFSLTRSEILPENLALDADLDRRYTELRRLAIETCAEATAEWLWSLRVHRHIEDVLGQDPVGKRSRRYLDLLRGLRGKDEYQQALTILNNLRSSKLNAETAAVAETFERRLVEMEIEQLLLDEQQKR